MGAPYHNLLSKIDRALVAYLVSKGAGTAADTFPAKRSQVASVPCTVCWAEKGDEVAPYAGTYICDVSVMVKSPAIVEDGASETESEARVGAVFDALHFGIDSAGNKLADLITAAARAVGGDLLDFTCLDVAIVGPEAGFEQDTDNWVDTLNLKVSACPANVS